MVHHREAEAAGLHDQARRARRRVGGRERRVEADRRHRDPEAVRADQPHPVPAADGEQGGPGGGVDRGGEHHQPAHPEAAAGVGRVDDLGRRHRQEREVGRFRQAGDIGKAGNPGDLAGIRVDRVETARVPAGLDVLEDRPADRARPPARADHRDRRGLEHRPEAGHVGGPLARRDRVQVRVELQPVVVRGQRDGDRDHAVGAPGGDGQAGVGEDAEHADVLRQRLGHERLDLPGPGERDQVLEQQGRDAALVHGVRDRERDLGRLAAAVPLDLVAGQADHLAAVDGEQGGVVEAGLPGHPPRLLLGGGPAQAEEAQIGVVGRHRLVHRLDGVEILGAAGLIWTVRPSDSSA